MRRMMKERFTLVTLAILLAGIPTVCYPQWESVDPLERAVDPLRQDKDCTDCPPEERAEERAPRDLDAGAKRGEDLRISPREAKGLFDAGKLMPEGKELFSAL